MVSSPQWWLRAWASSRKAAGVFARDVAHGMFAVSHNMLALIGLAVLAAGLFAFGHPEARLQVERSTLAWLQQRHIALQTGEQTTLAASLAAEARDGSPSGTDLARALAADPASLSRQQAAVAGWISRRYRVAPEPVARIVQEAWRVGQRAQLEPTLLLAIMAIESSFNPFAQSPVGAQGLMQVMTKIHNDKYDAFGGKLAAFDPATNLRVGVLVLKECIARAGSLEEGLRYYVGAANMESDGGYAGKVLSEQQYLLKVAAGKSVPVTAANIAVPLPAPPAAVAASAAAPLKAGWAQPTATAEVAADAAPAPAEEHVALAAPATPPVRR